MQDLRKIYENVESSRSESDSGSCIGCPRKENGTVWSRCCCCRGTEAGGHIGENTTMVLVPQVADAVQIPVIAAGGIADGRGVAAVFMLGAKGVQLGTRFVATEEAQVHENYKNCILKARDIDSRVTGRSTGHPVRALRNQMTKTYLQKEQEGAAFEELELLTLGGLKKWLLMGMFKMEVSWQVRSQG